jgi:hypothetical protein
MKNNTRKYLAEVKVDLKQQTFLTKEILDFLSTNGKIESVKTEDHLKRLKSDLIEQISGQIERKLLQPELVEEIQLFDCAILHNQKLIDQFDALQKQGVEYSGWDFEYKDGSGRYYQYHYPEFGGCNEDTLAHFCLFIYNTIAQ